LIEKKDSTVEEASAEAGGPAEAPVEEAEFDDETDFLATTIEKAEAPLEHEPPELDFDFDPNDPNGEEDLLK